MTAPLTYEVLGAVKIKDGVFIGDEMAASDLDFVVANKVTGIVNCSGRHVPNHYDSIGVQYLTYFWMDNDSQTILDSMDVNIGEIVGFIEELLTRGESVLIHSVRGQSRSGCVLAAYMMRKYSWTFVKTMEFLRSRRPDLNIKHSFEKQLRDYQSRLQNVNKQRLTHDWNGLPLGCNANPLECEEFLLRNTYLNSQMAQNDFLPAPFVSKDGQSQSIVWADDEGDEKSVLENIHNTMGTKRPLSLTKNHGGEMKSILKKKRISGGNENQENRIDRAERERERERAERDRERVERAEMVREVEREQRERKVWDQAAAETREPLGAWEETYRSRLGRSASRDSSLRESIDPRDTTESRDSLSREGGRTWETREARERSRQRMPSPNYGQRNDRQLDVPSPSRLSVGSKKLSYGFAAKRDPSPKGDIDRTFRSESPLRMKSPIQPAKYSTPSFGSISLPTRFDGPSVMSLGRPGAAQSAMGAYRSGPVKAKLDITGLSKQMRPQTAPSTRPNGGSRPASPLSMCHGSPHSRPASPMRLMQNVKTTSSIPFVDKQPRSLSSHMRRAPSPTPAFNRTTSPRKPRWRM